MAQVKQPSATNGEGLIERLRAHVYESSRNVDRDLTLQAAAKWIEKLERENLELRHDLERGMANHNADLNRTTVSETPRSMVDIELRAMGDMILLCGEEEVVGVKGYPEKLRALIDGLIEAKRTARSARRPRDGEACPTCGLAQGIQTGASHG